MKRWSVIKIIKEVVTTLLMIFVISMVLNYIRKPDTDSVLPNIKSMLISGDEISFIGDCPTCKLEASNLESIKDDAHFISVAVNSGSDDELKSFMQERGYTYDVVNDEDGKLSERFGVGAFPTTFIYDCNGTLKFSEVGYSTTLGLKARLSLVN